MPENKLTIAAVWAALLAMIASLVGVAVFVSALFCTIPVYLIWNHALIDAVPGLHPIGWWTAFGVAWFMRLFGRASGCTGACKVVPAKTSESCSSFETCDKSNCSSCEKSCEESCDCEEDENCAICEEDEPE